MDSNTQTPNNKKDTLIKSTSTVANDINNKVNPTSKVTHKVKIDDPYSQEHADIFDRDISLDYNGNDKFKEDYSKLSTQSSIVNETSNQALENTGNTKEFEVEKISTNLNSDIIPNISPVASQTNDKIDRLETELQPKVMDDEIDENIYKLDDDDSSIKPQGLLERLQNGYENVIDNDLFETFSGDSKRRLMIIIGIVVLVLMLCFCAFISQSLTGSTFFSMLQNRSSTSKLETIDEDVNSAFSGIWGDLSNQIDNSASASASNQSNSNTVSSKEQIIIKKIDKPYAERFLSDIAFNGTEEFIGSFILYKQFLLSLTSYNQSSTNKSGSEFMSKYGWKEGIITTLSGTYNGSKYTINQVLSRMPETSAVSALNDLGSNFNYIGCRVFELENNVESTNGTVKLFKVVCYNSSKYKNDPNGFLISKFAKKDIFGVIDIIGKSDIDLIKNITKITLSKLD